MSNKTYDILKWIALVFLPALQVLWLGLGKIWGFPYLVEIGATIACVDVFLGTLLGVSNVRYNATNTLQTTYNTEEFLKMIEVEDEDTEDTTEEQ